MLNVSNEQQTNKNKWKQMKPNLISSDLYTNILL